MRVVCDTIADFIKNLEIETPAHIYRGVVHSTVSSRPVDGDKRSAVKFDVTIQASAVIELPNGDQFILEVGELCGTDYRDNTQELNGTIRANELSGLLRVFCESNGVSLRPVIIAQ